MESGVGTSAGVGGSGHRQQLSAAALMAGRGGGVQLRRAGSLKKEIAEPRCSQNKQDVPGLSQNQSGGI